MPSRVNPASPRPAHGSGVVLLTTAQCREVDRLALEEFGLPGLVLMENAARHVAVAALDMLDDGNARPPVRAGIEGKEGSEAHAERGGTRGHVLVIAGPGNNGGDGLAAARHLHNLGVGVDVLLAYPASACRGDCAVHLRTVQSMGLPVREWAGVLTPPGVATPRLIIDALFGTGLALALDERASSIVRAVNTASASGGVRVLCVDVPTGMDADTGLAAGGGGGAGEIVRADTTITFAGVKPGLLAAAARPLVGNLLVGDIGVPRELIERLGTPLPGRGP